MTPKKSRTKNPKKKAPTVRKAALRTIARPAIQSVKTSKAVNVKAVQKPLTTKKPRRLHLGMHLIIAGSAICVMLLLGVIERNTFATKEGNASEAIPVTIGLEHSAPLSLSVLFAKKDNAGYVSITNQSSETIHLNLPSTWNRTEVTGASLKDVAQDIPVFGFSRWTLPGHAGMKLLMPAAPAAVFFDSVSASTAAIDLKTIDLTTLTVSNKVVLVQKQTLVPLWIGNE